MKNLHFIVFLLSLICSFTINAQSQWTQFTSPSPRPVDINLIESDNLSVRFNVEVFGMYEFDTTVLNTEFHRINIPGGAVSLTVGQPEMPFIKQLVAIPHCDDVSLSVNITGSMQFTNYNIYPAPDFIEVINPDSSISIEEIFAYDTIAYQQNQNYPQVSAEIVSTGYLRDQKYAEVFIYPVQFNPTTGNLEVNTNYELTLTFTNPAGPVNENTGIFNNVATNVFLNYVSSGITAEINDRPGHTDSVIWVDLQSQGQAGDIVADYLIITDEIFWDPSGLNTDLLKIARHRAEYNGFDVAIVKIGKVLELFTDPINIPLEKERAIRDFIYAVYAGNNANNTYDGKLGYVLLVGDAVKDDEYGVPTSYDPDPGASIFDDPYPSDYYYSCLTGEIPGTHDHVGDLFIGRFCCDTPVQLRNIIYKTVYYEREYHNKEISWKKNIGAFFGENACNNVKYPISFIDYLDGLVGDFGYNTSFFYSTSPNARWECLNYLRQDGSVIYYYVGHGHHQGWTDNSVDQNDVCTQVINDDKNQFIVSASCMTGSFDSQNTDCFAETTMHCKKHRGFVGCVASGRDIAICYGGFTTPTKFKDYIFTSIWANLSHIAGEFILESKVMTSSSQAHVQNIAYNYFGDPALNLMAEGFEITQDNFTFYCPTTISNVVTVREGVTCTIPNNCHVDFAENGNLIIDNGAKLIVGQGCEFQGINPQNVINVYGEITLQIGNNNPTSFTAPEGHKWQGLNISNLELLTSINQTLIFENCSFTVGASNIMMYPSNQRNNFINASFLYSQGTLNLNRTDFFNTEVLILHPKDENSKITINDCSFNNDDNVYYASILIEQYSNYNIHHNTINFSVADGITVFNCGDINESDMVADIANNIIHFTGEEPISNSGIKIFRSVADISNNEILGADFGIVGLNNSIITIEGNDNAPSPSETQIIKDNKTNQLYFANSSFPVNIEYNIIGSDENSNPEVYNDAQPQAGKLFDVINNCWDTDFNGNEDLVPNGFYEWEPTWCPGTTTTVEMTEEEVIYNSAMQNIDSGNYITAESELKQIIAVYPETETAKNAVKQLFELEKITDNDYQSLKTYFQTEPNLLNNNDLGKLADWMISYCNVDLGNYQEAIDWYDIVIDTTNSESDSTFAAIDMGEAYLAMGSGKALLQCNNSQFLFESEKAFDRNRKYLIDELLRSQKAGQVTDPDITRSRRSSIAKLYQNVPNPFNSTSIIKVELYEQCHIELEIFDMAGKKLLTLAKGIYKSGMHEFVINTNLFHDGIYFYSLNVNGANLGSKKMIIFK